MSSPKMISVPVHILSSDISDFNDLVKDGCENIGDAFLILMTCKMISTYSDSISIEELSEATGFELEYTGEIVEFLQEIDKL